MRNSMAAQAAYTYVFTICLHVWPQHHFARRTITCAYGYIFYTFILSRLYCTPPLCALPNYFLKSLLHVDHQSFTCVLLPHLLELLFLWNVHTNQFSFSQYSVDICGFAQTPLLVYQLPITYFPAYPFLYETLNTYLYIGSVTLVL